MGPLAWGSVTVPSLSDLALLDIRRFSSGCKDASMNITTTKHALERFIERILPKTDGHHRKYLSSPENAKKVLTSVANKSKLAKVESQPDSYDGYFTSSGKIMPIRLVIRDGVLITLWPLGGWTAISN